MAVKRTQTLIFKISMVTLIFLALVIGGSGVLTYFNEMATYRQQCETNLRDAGEYLETLIAEDAEDFARYQDYFLGHYAEIDIPADARDHVAYRTEYERLFQAAYPGRVLGVDIAFDELNDEVKRAYLKYRQVYWMQTFENARASFGLSYVYYLLPDDATESDIYIIDGTHPTRADHIALMEEYPYYREFDHPQGEQADLLYLGDQVKNARDEYPLKWEVWDSGEKQTGFQIWDNEYGKTYAYYTPVVLNGRKLGLIGTEIDVLSVNIAILNNTLKQFLIIGLLIVGMTAIGLGALNRRYTKRITDLEENVRDYSKTKDGGMAEKIRKNNRGHDEITSLSEGVAQMIDEIQTYISNKDRMQRALEEKTRENERLLAAVEFDELTGLYSQNFFLEFANRAFRGRPDRPADAVVVNVNQFHSVNELNGRDFGNKVLEALGDEIRAVFGDDRAHAIASRFNVDDFYIFCDPQPDYAALLERFQARVNALSDNATIRLRMGVMPWKAGLEPVQMLDRAHAACNRARSSDRHLLVYDDEMQARERLNERLLNDLDRALRDHEFMVFYQPKFNITVDPPCLSSAEALVRWQHPELGMISPDKFIPLFEENGLIQQLDGYVWREVASQMADWRDRFGTVYPVSVNVSRIDLYDPDFIDRISALVREFRIRHEDFLLEITESAYTEDSEQIVENVKKLRDAGFLIEMDDFGSGYSSLNMISTLPIDVIKLDMQFIRNAFRGQSDTRMLEAVLGIADMLYLPTVAEGVETAEQLNALRAMGCDIVQGYYFSKPVPADQYERFIRERMEAEEDTPTLERLRHMPRLSYEEHSYDELHDPLTGMYNTTAFEMLVKDADRYHTALLLAEVLGIEPARAGQGQDAADQALRHVAEVLRRSFRPVDHICRIGMDTFAIVMSRVDSGIQEQVAKKIDDINAMLAAPEHGVPAVSLAVGVAFADRADPGEDILADARAALKSLDGRAGCAFH